MSRISVRNISEFKDWRDVCKKLLSAEVRPEAVDWLEKEEPSSLFPSKDIETLRAVKELRMPKGFIPLAQLLSCHRDSKKWKLLYTLAWRIHQGERKLLSIPSDPDVRAAKLMCSAVSRDAHKAKAFIRFKRVANRQEAAREQFEAYHKAEHFALRRISSFLKDRFNTFDWKVSTPLESLSWDGSSLTFSEGTLPANQQNDEQEELWNEYYSSIFNPSRANPKAMMNEMPKKYWGHLPEAKLIPGLLRDANERSKEMQKASLALIKDFTQSIPQDVTDLESLRRELQNCSACELCKSATQVVCGEGKASSRLLIIGEQAGDREDLLGRPFIGPAGTLLRKTLNELKFRIDDIYFTNTVKHFRFRQVEKKRIHQKPKIEHISACKTWLQLEIQIIKPTVILCLGTVAAQAIHGPEFKVAKQRGLWVSEDSTDIIATYHPAAILRIPSGPKKDEVAQSFREDLKEVRARLDATKSVISHST